MTRRLSTIVALTVLTVIAAALRAYRLDSGLWYDEIVTLVESVRPPLSRILTEFPGNNNHPLYSVLAHLSISAFGEHPWGLRLPAMLFGVAAIPLLYVLGAAVASRAEAFLAAGVMTVSYHHIWFSQNARGYTALMFWTLLATWLFVRLTGNASANRGVAYAVALAFGTYTHLTMAFVAAAHAVIWVVVAWGRTDRAARRHDLKTAGWTLGLAGAGAAILYAPLIWQVYAFFGGAPQETAAVATPAWAVLEAVKGLRIGLGGVGALLATALVALGLLSYWRQSMPVTLAFTLPGVVTVAAMVLMRAPLRPRFLFNLLGFAVLLIVRGAFEAGRATVGLGVPARFHYAAGAAIVGFVVVFSLLTLPLQYRYPKQDFEGALRFVNANRSEREPVATGGLASYPFTYYYGMSWSAVREAQEIEGLRSRGERLWFVYSFPEYMDAGLVAALRAHCVPQQILPGTLGGGDVIVCAIEP